MRTYPSTSRVQPEEIDFLRDTLEASWPEIVPEGPTGYAPPPDDDDDSGGGGNDDADDTGGNDDSGNGDDDDTDDATAERTAARERESALKRRLAESEKARKKAEREAKDKQDGERVEAGQWKEVAEEREQTIAEKDAEIAELRGQIKDGAFGRTVVDVASRLRFRDPKLVAGMEQVRKLRDQAVDDDGEVDDAMVERELKKLAKAAYYLVLPEEKKQREVKGDDRIVRNAGGNGDGDYRIDPRGKMERGRRPIAARDRGGD